VSGIRLRSCLGSDVTYRARWRLPLHNFQSDRSARPRRDLATSTSRPTVPASLRKPWRPLSPHQISVLNCRASVVVGRQCPLLACPFRKFHPVRIGRLRGSDRALITRSARIDNVAESECNSPARARLGPPSSFGSCDHGLPRPRQTPAQQEARQVHRAVRPCG
jgi:hypothetical protein